MTTVAAVMIHAGRLSVIHTVHLFVRLRVRGMSGSSLGFGLVLGRRRWKLLTEMQLRVILSR